MPVDLAMDHTQALEQLADWRAAGLLRSLDVALAEELARLDPGAPGSLLLCAAMVARADGQGDVALDLGAVLAEAGPAPPGGRAADDLGADPAHDREDNAADTDRTAAAALRQALLAQPQGAGPVPAAGARHGPAALATLARQWAGSPLVRMAAHPAPAGAPLVLDGPRLYLARHWREETELAAALRARAMPLPAARQPQAAWLARWRAALFPPRAGAAAGAPDAQSEAAARALSARLLLVTGGPGTGKTWTAARVLALAAAAHARSQAPWHGPAHDDAESAHGAGAGQGAGSGRVPGVGREPLKVMLAAPTGKAAARLRESFEAALPGLAPPPGETLPPLPLPPARTLHALLGARPLTRRLRHGPGFPLDVDWLFVDEASMVPLTLLHALLRALPPEAHLVLLGDAEQLDAVEPGAVFGALCEAALQGGALAAQAVRLTESRRFGGVIGGLAAAVNAGDEAAARRLLVAGDPALAWRRPHSEEALVEQLAAAHHGLLQLVRAGPGAPDAAAHAAWVEQVLAAQAGVRVLCAFRNGPRGVLGLNAAIEASLRAAGLLRAGGGAAVEGRPLLVQRNQPELGLYNGDTGITLRAPPGEAGLRVWFGAGGRPPRGVVPARLAAVETAWAHTVHKSQGSEFGHVHLVLPAHASPLLTRELLYTAVTRAREAVTLWGGDEPMLAAALARRTRATSGLAARL